MLEQMLCCECVHALKKQLTKRQELPFFYLFWLFYLFGFLISQSELFHLWPERLEAKEPPPKEMEWHWNVSVMNLKNKQDRVEKASPWYINHCKLFPFFFVSVSHFPEKWYIRENKSGWYLKWKLRELWATLLSFESWFNISSNRGGSSFGFICRFLTH